MTSPYRFLVVLSVCALPFWPDAAHSMSRDSLFTTEMAHEIEIDLPSGDWYQVLSNNRQSETYVAGTFTIDGEEVDSVGVRFKGNSTWGHPGRKKPFRIKFSEYREDQTLGGVPSVVLNNGFKDPSLLRETVGYEMIRELGYGCLTSFANVTVNGEFVGFYTLVETIGGTWIENRMGSSEDGNLWKSGGPTQNNGGDLSYRGDNQGSYTNYYELKSNEEEDDWTALIDFVDRLNNTPLSDLPDSIAPVLEVDRWLRHHAFNIASVNLDAYEGSTRNYYMYAREDDGRFVHLPWDFNEVWGSYSQGLSGSEMRNMSALWEDRSNRPFVERILDVDLYREMYLRHMDNLVQTLWTNEEFDERVDELADVIRSDVYADNNKMYSNSDFERNLNDDISDGRFTIFGLTSFVEDRNSALTSELDGVLATQLIYLNELMADNETTVTDDLGDYDDYVEIYNRASVDVSLAGFGLTDDHLIPFQWTLPAAAVVPAGGRLVLWLDGEIEEGDLHGPFGLDSDGEELFLFSQDEDLVDFLVFDGLDVDEAWGRRTDGGHWIESIPASPDEENADGLGPEVGEIRMDRYFPAAGRELNVEVTVTATTAPVALVELVVDAGAGEVTIPMDGSGDTWTGTIEGDEYGTAIAYYVVARDDDGRESVAPSGAPERNWNTSVFVGRSPVTINEFVADNVAGLQDDEGDFDDWIELTNVGEVDVDLSGFHLTDDAGDPDQWTFPAGTVIGAGDYLLVFADGDEGVDQLHASFKLGKDGEFVGLYAPTGAVPLDTLSFGVQLSDISEARAPDGLGEFSTDHSPTPDAYNEAGGLVAVAVSDDAVVEVPRSGGSFRLQASIFNRGESADSAEAWTAAILNTSEFEPLAGPLSITVPALDLVTAPVVQVVPGGAPTIVADYELRVGTWGGEVETTDGFPVTKLP